MLIHILVRKGDLFDAERYAQVTYGNLRDKKNGINQESENVAFGAFNLANVILRQNGAGDLVRAEFLARESLQIRNLIYGSNHVNVGLSCELVANILRAQNKLGDETKDLYERYIAISIQNDGLEGTNTATGNFNIANFYYMLARSQLTRDLKQTNLLLAKSHFEKALCTYTQTYGSAHPDTVETKSRLTFILRELS
jgi:hypothetical protein